MNFKLMPLFITGVTLGLYTGCGGGGSSSEGASGSVESFTTYKVHVVDDAVVAANVEAVGCKNSKDLGEGDYSFECTNPPKYIMAKGGFVDVNKNGEHDDNETAMGLPLLLNLDKKLFDVNMSNISVTPLSTLVANIHDKNELTALATKLGIDEKDFNRDISTENKELFQKLNALLVIAQGAGITNQLLLMKKLRASINSSSSTDINAILTDALTGLKDDDELKRAYGATFITGFVDESKRYMNESDVLKELAKEYADNDDSKVFITGFIYDGVIKDANISILDGEIKVGSAISTQSGRWKISIPKSILEVDKVLIFTGTAIDANGDKILLKSAITTQYLRDLSKKRISVADSIDLVISNVTTAQVAILEKNDRDFSTKPDELEEKKNKIEVFQQEVLLKAAAAIKAIIDGEVRIEADADTYSFIVDNLVVTNEEEERVELDIDGKITEDEITRQSNVIQEDAILSQQLLTIESDKPLTPILGESLFIVQYDLASSSKTYVEYKISSNKLISNYYYLDDKTWKKSGSHEFAGKIINNVFYFDTEVAEGESPIAPYAITLKERKTVHSSVVNKDYTFDVLASQLYQPYEGMDTEKVNIYLKAEDFDVVTVFKGLTDEKIAEKLPSNYASLTNNEKNLLLSNYLISEITKLPEPFDRNSTKLTSALDIAKDVDLENDDIGVKLSSIKSILESAEADDKDAQVGKALFSLAEVTNSETAGSLVELKSDGSSVTTNDNLATLLDANKDHIEAELLASITNLSGTSMELLHETVLKLQDINSTLGENFSDERYTFTYDDVNITNNQSKLIRVGALTAASELEYLTAFNYVNIDDAKTRTTSRNGVTAEYTTVSADPVSVFSRTEVGSVNVSIGVERLAHSKALLLEAIDILDTVVASKEDEDLKKSIQDAQAETAALKASLNGTGLYEVEEEMHNGTVTETTYLDLSALYSSSTALDLTHTLGHNIEYEADHHNHNGYRAGAYNLGVSQFYNEPMSNQWVSESNGTVVSYDSISVGEPRLDWEMKSIPTGSSSHIPSVVKKIEIKESGKATITHTGDNVLKYLFNDIRWRNDYNDVDKTMTYRVEKDDNMIPDSTVTYNVELIYGNVEFTNLDSVNGVVTVEVKSGFSGQQCFGLKVRDSLGHLERADNCIYKN